MTALIDPSQSRRYLRHGMLPQLAAFEAVVRLGSARHAADSLCMAQPTLSGHLRKLSEALGVRLFELKGKRLVPTDAALVLLHAAHEVFAAFAHCEWVLAGVRSGSRVNALGQIGTEGLDTVGPPTGIDFAFDDDALTLPPAPPKPLLPGAGTNPRAHRGQSAHAVP